MDTDKLRTLMENLISHDYWRNIEKETFNEDWLFEESEKSQLRRIFKAFGKIKVPREIWNGVRGGTVELPQSFKTKYFMVSLLGLPKFSVDEIEEILKEIPLLSLEQILKRLKQCFNGRTPELLHYSNLRLVFQFPHKKSLIEIRYNKKVFEQRNSHQENAEAPEHVLVKPTDKKDEKEFTPEEVNSAKRLKQEDASQIAKKIQFVRDNLSLTYEDMEKEKTNFSKIQKEAKCPHELALKAGSRAGIYYDESAKKEPAITRDVVDCVSGASGTMFGLPFRLKQPTSLGRKIAEDALAIGKKYNLSQDAAIMIALYGIKDAIRYTAAFPADRFTIGYNKVKRFMQKKGYKEIRCKNFFQYYEKGTSQQKAIQCVFKAPDGTLFEFQFHTINSLGIKEINHKLYEEYRSESTPVSKKRILDLRMKMLSANVEAPAGVFGIRDYSLPVSS